MFAPESIGLAETPEEERKKMEQAAMSQYGAPFEQLSPEQKKALFTNYISQRAQANHLMTDPVPRMKRAGQVAVAPTWSENLAHGVKVGMGHVQNAKLNRLEEQGRETAGDLAAQEAVRREEERRRDRDREDERFMQMIGLFGTGR